MSLQSKLNLNNKLTDKQVKALTDLLIKEYSKALKDIKSEIAFHYEKYATGDILTYAEMAKYNRLTGLEKELNKRITELYENAGVNLKNSLNDIYKDSYYYTFWGIEAESKILLDFALLNPEKIEKAILNKIDGLTLDDRLEGHRKDTISQINEEITQGLIKGQAYSKTAQNVSERLGVSAGKSVRIVQTETHRIHNLARTESFDEAEEMGIDLKRKWDAAKDTRTRDTHQELDGKYADKNGYWYMDGYSTRYPGGFAAAYLSVNCRCATRAEINGIKPTSMAARNQETGKTVRVSSMTYKEWFATHFS